MPLSAINCHFGCVGPRDCDPVVDNDDVDGLGVDARGRILVAGHLIGGTIKDATTTSFVRSLTR